MLAAAWPLIGDDLGLSYVEIGLLLSVPAFVGLAVEPVLGILGDTSLRRALVLGGGVAFAGAWLVVAGASTFGLLLAGLIVASPASGAFVSLAQATLMDASGGARERAMAAWTLAGSFGVVAAPLLVAASTLAGFGWREPIGLLALGTLPLLAFVRSAPFTADRGAGAAIVLRRALSALRRREVLGWLGLLEVTDLMLDVLHGFLALYLVDAAGASPAAAAAGVAVWSAAGLAGDAGLLVVLRHVDGLTYLRGSAAAVALVFPLFLLVPGFEAKLVPLAILGLLSAGWYAIPKARLYTALPDQSGTAMALGTVTGFAGGAFPLAIGAVAATFGISAALWIPLAAPLVVLAAVARR